jgi:cytochrome P450
MLDRQMPDYYTDPSLVDDPHPFFDQIRSRGPVVYLQDRNVAAITGYEEAVAVYNDTEHFSSIVAVTGPLPALPFEPEGDDITAQIEEYRDRIPFGREVAALPAPEHTRLRSLLNPLFTPARLRAMDPGFRRVADQLIDEFNCDGRVEFVGFYANPLATLIITELLGIPQSDRPIFRNYFDGGTVAGVGASTEEIAHNPLIEIGTRIAGYIVERRQVPGSDILSGFATAVYPDGSVPTVEEAARVASFLFGAGQDTTTKLLGTSLRIISERPHLQQMLRDHPEHIPDFIEEVLRYDGSIKASHRLCQRSTTIGGVDIPAGTVVLISNLAANRDARRFDDPDKFEINRPRRKEHLAFGRGTHTCAGAALARTEVRITLEHLLRRFATITVDEDMHGPLGNRRYRYEQSYVLRGLEELHLILT